MEPKAGEITHLLSRLAAGDHSAEAEVFALVYPNLRRLAKRYLAAERRDHTLQATALVHEAYLKLTSHMEIEWQNRAQFFAVAARAMRRILVDHARGVKAAKRGGLKISLESVLTFVPEQSAELLALNEALDRLAGWDARQAQVVELKFFGGMSVEEIAEILSIAPRTVKMDWQLARAWLHGQLTRWATIDEALEQAEGSV
jgi:RNA polymerase sigma factor (TIGR02999 family)